MKLCIPITEYKGLDSEVCAHFGSAPRFLIVDTESRELNVVENTNTHHTHGMCQPLRLFEGLELGGMVVGGIGRGALMKLHAGGVEVFLSRESTVAATLEALEAGRLGRADMDSACAGHGSQSPRGH